MPFRVLVTPRSFRKQSGEHKRILLEADCELVEATQDRPLKAAELLELIPEADALIVGLDEVTEEVIAAGQRLKVISKYGVGLDNIDIPAATAAKIVVTNTPGTNHVAVAELTMGLLLALARRIPQHNNSAKAGSWARVTGVELAGRALGLLGLGQISREVIKRAASFSMRLLVHTSHPAEELVKAYEVAYVPLEHLLSNSDFVSLHCALTPERVGLIGEKELRMMKPTSYLVNTARGELVDEEALYRALHEGWIAGAASDVFAHEPPTGSPLLGLDNFIITPHMGANTYEAIQRMGVMAAQNAILALRGQRPLYVVNPEVYTR